MILENGTTSDNIDSGSTSVDERVSWASKVKAEFLNHASVDAPPELEDLIFELPYDKLGSPTNRSYFIKKMAEYILSSQGRLSEWPQYEPLIVKLALCSEITISIQYYHNYVFDAKAGVTNSLAIRKAVIQANLLKSWFFTYIRVSFSPYNLAEKVAERVDEAFNYTDMGQYIEGSFNSYEAYLERRVDKSIPYFQKDKNIDWAVIDHCIKIVKKHAKFSDFEISFLRSYFLRLYLVGSVLYRSYTVLLLDLLNECKENKQRLKKFAVYYGIMLQIVNDNSDFVPGYMQQDTKAKCQQDMQSDIRNKNITLPLILYLHFNPSEQTLIKKYLNSFKTKKYSERRETLIFEHIYPVLTEYAIPIGKTVASAADNLAPLELTSIARSNRFYQIVYDYFTYAI